MTLEQFLTAAIPPAATVVVYLIRHLKATSRRIATTSGKHACRRLMWWTRPTLWGRR